MIQNFSGSLKDLFNFRNKSGYN